MPRGSSEIPQLRLEVLKKFVTTFQGNPDLYLKTLFPVANAESSSIKWESQRGGRGMTPFVPPGSPAPVHAPHGIAQHRAEAAYWKEKMFFDEEFLNNLRQEGTVQGYKNAKKRLAKELAGLVNRDARRVEWMYAQMLFNGSFTYRVQGGYNVNVNYQLPPDHVVTLASTHQWNAGATKNILKDIQDGKRKIKEDCGGKVDLAICNSRVLTYLANDTTIRGILYKSAFGDGSLYKGNLHDIVGVNPSVLGALLDIKNFVVYDEVYEIKAWITNAITGGASTWIGVDEATDFVAGERLRFHDRSAGTFEDVRIVSVDIANERLQVSPQPNSSYKAMEDFVTMTKPFVPDDKFIMIATRVDGDPIAEFYRAPFGLGRHWGTFTDKHDEWDPEITAIRVQNKGLPVLYNRDAIYILDVQSTTAEAVTSTTSTSSTISTTSSTSSTSSTQSTTSSTSSTMSTSSTQSTTSTDAP